MKLRLSFVPSSDKDSAVFYLDRGMVEFLKGHVEYLISCAANKGDYDEIVKLIHMREDLVSALEQMDGKTEEEQTDE